MVFYTQKNGRSPVLDGALRKVRDLPHIGRQSRERWAVYYLFPGALGALAANGHELPQIIHEGSFPFAIDINPGGSES
jgi:hypothetical protein